VWAVASAANLSGRFYVAIAGHTATAAISAASGTAADMLAALESLPTVPAGVQVSAAAVSSGRRWRVTFPATVSNKTPALLVSTSSTLAAAASNATAGAAAGSVATAGSLRGTAAHVYTSVDVQGGLPTSFVTPRGLLTPGAQYYATVATYTAASGWSTAAAAAAAATTAVQPPSPPLDVTAATASATTVEVAWTAPAESGGSSVQYYSVQWSTDSGFTAAAAGEATVHTPAVSYTIKSLVPSTTYFVRVAAGNAAGLSEPSATAARSASEAQIIVFTSTIATGTCPADALVDGLYIITVTDPVTGVSSSTPTAAPLRPDATATQASHCTVNYR
jgi:Fibronectin type III domain